ncbi:MAG TPA: PilN domain-containing protein [Desulfitobacteriaceae bacterium]|nr:PilN domain-containing protein [Desulfitobacteriaceae bacterium]
MAKIILTIEISDQELRILCLTRKSGVKKILAKEIPVFDIIILPNGVIEQGILKNKEVFISLWQKYLADKKLTGAITVNFLIPFQLGFLRTYCLPWISKAERLSAVGFLIDEEVPIPGSDLLSDYIILEDDRKNNLFHILVGAARKSIIQAYIEAFSQINIEVRNIDCALSVLGYVLNLKNNEESLYLQVENQTLQLIIFNGIVPEVVRTFYPDLSAVSPDEEWEREIQKVLLYYGNQRSALSLRKICFAGERAAEDMAERICKAGWASQIQPADAVKIPDLWQKVCPKWPEKAKTVTGYVLRIRQKAPGINLWRQQMARKRRNFTSRIIYVLCALILLTGCIVLFPLQLKKNQLQNEVDKLRIQGSDTIAFSNQLNNLEKAWSEARNYQLYVGEYLTEIQRLLPTGIELNNLEYKEGNLSLQGTTTEADQIEKLLATLKSMGLEHPLLTTYQQTEQASLKFVITTGTADQAQAVSN